MVSNISMKKILWQAIIIGIFCTSPAYADDKVGVVDFDDRIVIPCEYEIIEYLGNGLYQCFEEQTDPNSDRALLPFKIMNSEGRPVPLNFPQHYRMVQLLIPESYPKPTKHLNSLPQNAFALLKGPKGYGLWNSAGSMLIPPEYEEISHGDYVTATAYKVDANGKLAGHKFQIGKLRNEFYQSAEMQLSENLVVFREESHKPEDKYGYSFQHFNKPGVPSIRIPVTIEHPIRFGYKDKNAKVVIPATFTEASNFHNGLAIVKTTKPTEISEYYYINLNGKIVSPKFWRAQEFKDGRAVVAINDNSAIPYPGQSIGTQIFGRYGLIDDKFKFVIEPKFESLRQIYPNRYLTQSLKNEPSQILDRDGKIIKNLPFRCTSFKRLTEKTWLATNPDAASMEIPAGVILNENFEIIAKLPLRANIVEKTSQQLIYNTTSGNGNTDDAEGQELVFCTLDGEIKKRVPFRGYIDKLCFEHNLIVLPVREKIPFSNDYDESQLQGVLDMNGEWRIKPQPATFQIVEDNRIIKTLKETFPKSDFNNGVIRPRIRE